MQPISRNHWLTRPLKSNHTYSLLCIYRSTDMSIKFLYVLHSLLQAQATNKFHQGSFTWAFEVANVSFTCIGRSAGCNFLQVLSWHTKLRVALDVEKLHCIMHVYLMQRAGSFKLAGLLVAQTNIFSWLCRTPLDARNATTRRTVLHTGPRFMIPLALQTH